VTFEQSPHAALDQIIRQARHVLISFDDPIRSAVTGNPAAHISDVLTACRESGRSAAIVATTTPVAEVRAYLDAHDLPPYSTFIAPSIGVAVSAFEASPTDCVAITSSASDIEAARAAGVPAIAYAKTPDDADHLLSAGARAFIYSMTDLALRLRSFNQEL
jgi:beta-phosphoglucomutase-like phosphatase (HAD superfamily)